MPATADLVGSGWILLESNAAPAGTTASLSRLGGSSSSSVFCTAKSLRLWEAMGGDGDGDGE